MTDFDEARYYQRRAEQADALARRASESHIKKIHKSMAADYRALAQESNKLSVMKNYLVK